MTRKRPTVCVPRKVIAKHNKPHYALDTSKLHELFTTEPQILRISRLCMFVVKDTMNLSPEQSFYIIVGIVSNRESNLSRT